MLIVIPFTEKLQKIIKKLQQVTRGYNKITSTESVRIMLALVATQPLHHIPPSPYTKKLYYTITLPLHHTTILLYYIPTNTI